MLISKQRLVGRASDLLYGFKKQPVEHLKAFIAHPHWQWYSSARWALEDLLGQLRQLHVKSNQKRTPFTVAIPAFTCKVVADAAKRAQCEISYYDTGIITSISQLISWVESQTKIPHVLLLSYNLGFVPQDIKKLAQYCKKHNIILIEDCAQALGATSDAKMVGSFASYAIYSFGISKNLGATGAILATRKPFSSSNSQKMPVLEKVKILLMLASNSILLHPLIFKVTNSILRESEEKQYDAKKYSLPPYFQNIILHQAKRYPQILSSRRKSLEQVKNLQHEKYRVVIDPKGTKGSALYLSFLSTKRDHIRKEAEARGLDIYQMYSFKNLAGSATNFPLASKAESQHLCLAAFRSQKEMQKIISILQEI